MPLVKIRSHTFKLSEPYSDGKPIGLNERRVLDSVRTENLRDLIRKRLDALDWPLESEALSQFTKLVEKLDVEYEFRLADSRQPREGPFDRLLHLVAVEEAEAALSRGQIGQAEFDLTVSQYKARAELREEAQRRLDIRTRASKLALEELL